MRRRDFFWYISFTQIVKSKIHKMKTKNLLIASLTVLAMFACKKKDDTAQENPDPPSFAMFSNGNGAVVRLNPNINLEQDHQDFTTLMDSLDVDEDGKMDLEFRNYAADGSVGIFYANSISVLNPEFSLALETISQTLYECEGKTNNFEQALQKQRVITHDHISCFAQLPDSLCSQITSEIKVPRLLGFNDELSATSNLWEEKIFLNKGAQTFEYVKTKETQDSVWYDFTTREDFCYQFPQNLEQFIGIKKGEGENAKFGYLKIMFTEGMNTSYRLWVRESVIQK